MNNSFVHDISASRAHRWRVLISCEEKILSFQYKMMTLRILHRMKCQRKLRKRVKEKRIGVLVAVRMGDCCQFTVANVKPADDEDGSF